MPRRWAHTQGVAARARTLAPILGDEADLIEAAAWLHDIGYSPALAATGFHPLDGARYLREVQVDGDVLCRLVANHSCAIIEARQRGLANELSNEFPRVDPALEDALTYCDMTTAPDGSTPGTLGVSVFLGCSAFRVLYVFLSLFSWWCRRRAGMDRTRVSRRVRRAVPRSAAPGRGRFLLPDGLYPGR